MLNCGWECWDYRLLLLWRMYREATFLGCVPSWNPPWSSVIRHVFFWTTTWKLRTTYLRSRRDLLWEDDDSETHKFRFWVGRKTVGTAGLRRNKDMGNFWACFWLIAWWGSREVLGLVGEEGLEQGCTEPPQGWRIVNKDLFLPIPIFGSCTKGPRGWNPLCSVTFLQPLKG